MSSFVGSELPHSLRVSVVSNKGFERMINECYGIDETVPIPSVV